MTTLQQHQDIWRAIDMLAERHGLSASALARRAGLDATAFNRSKRFGKDGRPRWPSTESIAAVLNAVHASVGELAELVSGERQRGAPVMALEQAGGADCFDAAGHPVGRSWRREHLPGLGPASVWALEVTSRDLMPAIRPGDRLVLIADRAPAPGDRVVVCTQAAQLLVRELGRTKAGRTEFIPISPPARGHWLETAQIAWMTRILWIGH